MGLRTTPTMIPTRSFLFTRKHRPLICSHLITMLRKLTMSADVCMIFIFQIVQTQPFTSFSHLSMQRLLHVRIARLSLVPWRGYYMWWIVSVLPSRLQLEGSWYQTLVMLFTISLLQVLRYLWETIVDANLLLTTHITKD